MFEDYILIFHDVISLYVEVCLTWMGTVMCQGIPDKACSTKLAPEPTGVVDAA